MAVTPEALCRLASIVCVLNEAAENAAMKFDLPEDSVLVLQDAEGNMVRMWSFDGKLSIESIA